MPRVHIHVQDVESFVDLDGDELLEEELGFTAPQKSIGRDTPEQRSNGIRRFGGTEAIDRKRAERRKQSRRRT